MTADSLLQSERYQLCLLHERDRYIIYVKSFCCYSCTVHWYFVGSNDPSPPPKELYNCESPKKGHGVEESCRFCSLHSDPPRVQRQAEVSCSSDCKINSTNNALAKRVSLSPSEKYAWYEVPLLRFVDQSVRNLRKPLQDLQNPLGIPRTMQAVPNGYNCISICGEVFQSMKTRVTSGMLVELDLSLSPRGKLSSQ